MVSKQDLVKRELDKCFIGSVVYTGTDFDANAHGKASVYFTILKYEPMTTKGKITGFIYKEHGSNNEDISLQDTLRSVPNRLILKSTDVNNNENYEALEYALLISLNELSLITDASEKIEIISTEIIQGDTSDKFDIYKDVIQPILEKIGVKK